MNNKAADRLHRHDTQSTDGSCLSVCMPRPDPDHLGCEGVENWDGPASHALKSASGTFGLMRLQAHCASLQHAENLGRIDALISLATSLPEIANPSLAGALRLPEAQFDISRHQFCPIMLNHKYPERAGEVRVALRVNPGDQGSNRLSPLLGDFANSAPKNRFQTHRCAMSGNGQ